MVATSNRVAVSPEPERENRKFPLSSMFSRIRRMRRKIFSAHWRSKAAITDALLTAELHSRSSRDLAELDWETRLLPIQPKTKTRDLDSWEMRLLPTLNEPRIAAASWEDRLLPKASTLRMGSRKAIDSWERVLLESTPVVAATRDGLTGWEERLLP